MSITMQNVQSYQTPVVLVDAYAFCLFCGAVALFIYIYIYTHASQGHFCQTLILLPECVGQQQQDITVGTPTQSL